MKNHLTHNNSHLSKKRWGKRRRYTWDDKHVYAKNSTAHDGKERDEFNSARTGSQHDMRDQLTRLTGGEIEREDLGRGERPLWHSTHGGHVWEDHRRYHPRWSRPRHTVQWFWVWSKVTSFGRGVDRRTLTTSQRTHVCVTITVMVMVM